MKIQPIETAPKNRRILLLVPMYRGATWMCGQWNDNKDAKRPRPYWTNDNERLFGVRWARESQPTHWCELPTTNSKALDDIQQTLDALGRLV